MAANEEAVKYVWEGAIPLQIHLHKSEVASHPPPPPALVLAPRIGYLPLLDHLIKPYFKDSLPPGEDSIWFDYKGLPLKWYAIAAYIINGNCKNVMNMSQSDQEDLWTSVMNGTSVPCDLDAYTRLSPKIKMGNIEDEFSRKASVSSPQSRQGGTEIDVAGQVKTARVPVRLYVRSVSKDFENLEDVPEMDTWDEISYLNRPVDFLREEGKCFTLRDAIESLLPEYIRDRAQTSGEEGEERTTDASDVSQETRGEIKMVRIQGIEMKLEIPFSWVVNNLMNPEFYLHVSVLVKEPQR
ncbi:hypothetical protein Bca4012_048034 [Brassica carinata]